MRLRVKTTGALAAACLMSGVGAVCAGSDAAPPTGSRTAHRVVELASGLAHPWSIAFLPDGAALIAERTGGLRVLRDQKHVSEPLPGLPVVHQKADAGLLGLAIHPKFATNRTIYLCFARGSTDANASAVLRARLDATRLANVEVIFEARPLKKKEGHFGCRLLFLPDQTLLIALGDGYDYRDQAQALDSHLGKVVRVTDTGAVPRDNPFVRRNAALPQIYTFGHRNVQGMVLHPGGREVWIHEHGPRGGDEVNVLHAGANYGWPLATFGIDYSGESISQFTKRPGMEPPRFYWVPSIAPSGMAFYDGERFPEWRGDLFVGGLASRALHRLDIEGDRIIGQEILLADRKERIRDVVNGPEGLIYVLTDAADGKLLRIEPLAASP